MQKEHVIGLDVFHLSLVEKELAGVNVIRGKENNVDKDQEDLHGKT